ncbi:MAG: flagellar hook-associated protein FlgK, partial [Pseudomonadota bacterium]
AQGTDLDGNAGGDLLSVGEASVRPGDRNARDALGQPATSVQITRVAGSGADLRASDYELRTDPSDASAYQVTRLSDGKVFSGVASGATLDGFRIDVSGSAMASGDRFTLQPVSQAAQNAGVAIADGRKIAAAGSASAGSGNANALKLQSLATAKTFEGRSFTDAHSRMVADLGVKVQRAESDSTASTAVADRVTEQISSETGVNLEEEAARLIQFQQNYQVAAKVLNTTQKIFDTILSIMN